MVLERFRLDDEVAVVTGASRGIGRGTVLALAEAGAHVVLAARRTGPLEEVAEAVRGLGREALVVPTDMTDPDAIDALARAAREWRGRVDVLVNNAGGALPTVALQVEDKAMHDAFQFNVTAPLRLARQLAPTLALHHGAIVNISSSMASLVDTGFVAYGSAKAALSHMTRLLAHEWAPRVRVNALEVGATLTDALAPLVAMEELRDEMVSRIPMGRLGQPEDVAAAVLFLASDAAGWITGQTWAVDGGTVRSTFPMDVPSGL